MLKTRTVFRVYENRPEFKKAGTAKGKKFVREFKTRKAAENFMNKSIFRFVEEVVIFEI